MSLASVADGLNDIYESLERYNWDDDVEFQSGLSAILGSNSTPEQATELALRARCFYYARKFNINIDFDGYKAYRNARGRPPPVLSSATNGISQASADTISIPESNNEAAGGIMPATTSSTEPPAPYPTSFAHIVELISNGQPVPGIKEIPSTVLEGQGTQSAKQRRKKPWENEENGMAEEVA